MGTLFRKGRKRMSDAEIKLFEVKTQQIKEILESEDITYGMARMIIQKVEAELLKSGDIFLNRSKFKNISPIMFINHR